MRDNIKDKLKQKQTGSSQALSWVRASWKSYGKLVLGILLMTVVLVFVIQNADYARVKFFGWEVRMSQALVVFLALLSGVVFGLVFNRWQRWRTSAKR